MSPMYAGGAGRARMSFKKTISLQNPFEFSEEKTHRNTIVGKPNEEDEFMPSDDFEEGSMRQSFDETGSKSDEK